MRVLKRILKFLASLQFAVVVIALIAALISLGTFVEAQYDAWTAKNLVYNSIWMFGALGLLTLSLLAVIADRWPWKTRHIAFILAHLGIIVLIYGSLVTLLYGVDGTIRLTHDFADVSQVQVQETEINVYRSRDGNSFEKAVSEEVNFLKDPVKAGRPFVIKAKGLQFEILSSIPYGIAKEVIEPSNENKNGSAVRFQFSNASISQVDWLMQKNIFEKVEKSLGPVMITLGGLWERLPGKNEIRLYQEKDQSLRYLVFNKDSVIPIKRGSLGEGDAVQTGWMGLDFKVLRYFPKANQRYDVTETDRPTPLTRPSLKIRYNGVEDFLVLNDYVKVFTDEWVYLVFYQNKRIPLEFPISLKSFEKINYQGTSKAMEYQSVVKYDGNEEAVISMNQPLKHKGFYIYQASFEQSPSGAVTSSILSVNKDPGRSWKYAGSLMICLGIVLMFYFRYQSRL